MTEADEIREEIAQLEDWFRNGVIDEAKYYEKLAKLDAELDEAIAREPPPEPVMEADVSVVEDVVAASPPPAVEREVPPAAPEPAPVDTESSSNDPISALERLQKLRADGALSDVEFEAQKRALLGIAAEKPTAVEPEKSAPKSETKPAEAANNNSPATPHEMVSAVVALILFAVGGWYLFGAIFGGGIASATGANKTFLVSVTSGQQLDYGCRLNVEFRNPGDDLIPWVYVKTSAVDAGGKVLGVTNASSSNLRGKGIGVSSLTFQNVDCYEIRRLRGADVTVGTMVEVAKDTIVPLDL